MTTDEQITPVAPQAENLADLPEWAQKQIRDLRRESAGYRTRVTGLEADVQAAQDAATQVANEAQTTIAGLEAQRTALEVDRARTNLAVTRGLPLTVQDSAGNPVAVTSLIVGATDEERAASADVLVALYGGAKPEPLSPDPAQIAPAAGSDSRAAMAEAFFAAADAN